jgi:hypothetical protein
MDKINPKVLAITFAIIAFIADVAGYVWHVILGQPSIMDLLYPGFWGNWNLMLTALAACLVSAYALGYVFAWVYNWSGKRFK